MPDSNLTSNKLPYWITLLSLFVLSLIAGIIGFQQYFSHHNIDHNWVRSLYCTLQLYAFEGGDLNRSIPVLLEIARFSAPVTTIMAFIMTLIEIFRERLNDLAISRMKNHSVIIGFGTKGKSIMYELLEDNERILIIEKDPDNPNLSAARSNGCRVLQGDGTDINALIKARITKANKIHLVMGDDRAQVNCCLDVYRLVKKSDRSNDNAVICYMHLQNQESLNTIQSHEIVADINDGMILKIFNSYQFAAREMFLEHPPDGDGIPEGSTKYVQIVIFGFGKAGQALALQTAHTAQYINADIKKSKVLVVDRDADIKVLGFLDLYPAFGQFCDLEYLKMDSNSPQLVHGLRGHLSDPDVMTTIVLCFDDRTYNLFLGMHLERHEIHQIGHIRKILVRTDDAAVLNVVNNELEPYALPSAVCSPKRIADSKLDEQAMAIHGNYLQNEHRINAFADGELRKIWEGLGEEMKDSNRKVADHIRVKARSIGCEIVDISDAREQAILTDDEVLSLAKMEHRRWWAERALAGWTKGEVNEKNPATRENPSMTRWKELAESDKEKDLSQVNNIHNVLALAGEKLVRKNNGQ